MKEETRGMDDIFKEESCCKMAHQIVQLGYTIVAMVLLSIFMYLSFGGTSSECKQFHSPRGFYLGRF